ncbi:MAG: GMC family oxidoreductase N-terminal domain-containing protein, partial [Bacteroidota bacterium]
MKYDYIIVGAGSAGCVLANRLSADPSNQVLLLEAGGSDRHPYIHIPGAYVKLHRSKMDWGYWTAPQKHLNNRKIYLPRGKVLGGCSSTNAMAYVRGNKEDYNDWAKLGNSSWSYEAILPYFKRAEHNVQFQNAYHGTAGELHVGHGAFQTPYSGAFIDACVACGIPANPDCNGASQTGAGRFQFTIKNGKRYSGVDAFLRPAMSRKN